LLVSRVLAKHVPTEPGIASSAGLLLGLLVRAELQAPAAERPAGGPTPPAPFLGAVIDEAAEKLGRLLASDPAENPAEDPAERGCSAGRESRRARMSAVAELCELLEGQQAELPGVVTIGYAETATGLGQLVAGQLGTYYIHSTREAAGAEGVAPYGAFEEMHSHATSHQLLPTSRAALDLAETVVLVDDELSTGATIINTIRELHGTAPHGRYVVASLVDLRSAEDRGRLEALAGELGTRISAVALAHGNIQLPELLAADAAELIRGLPLPDEATPVPGQVRLVDLNDVVPPIRSARFGIAGRPEPGQAAEIAAALTASLSAAPGDRVLVLATEEFMALPLAVAARLQELWPDNEVRYSTSTRSPIAVLDEPGYAIRSAVAFDSDDDAPDGPGPRFAYNFAHPEERPPG
jgi:adenine/guanine phosphoribosyltransferase-like PRPP-binding protein